MTAAPPELIHTIIAVAAGIAVSVAVPCLLLWRAGKEITRLELALKGEQTDNSRLRRELFHNTKTRRIEWPWPPPFPPNGEDS